MKIHRRLESNTIQLMPHNEMLYSKIVEKLEAGERSIFYSEGTGLGKSFLFMKLMEEYFYDKRVLYIVPKIAVWDNMTSYEEFKSIDNGITMKTFADFNVTEKEDRKARDFDVIFIDECHHLLSDIQGTNLNKFKDKVIENGGYAFGMTATPYIRGMFVDEECFKVSCYGYDIFDAVVNGLLPKIDCALAVPEILDVPKELAKKYSIDGTKTVLEQVIGDYKHITHWLAYFSCVEDLNTGEDALRKLFPDFEIIKIYYGLEDIESRLRYYREYKGNIIMMSVSMLLEGTHIDNVGGVLLYRNVIENSTYNQIVGRLCNIRAKHTPVLLDITNSALSLKERNFTKSKRATEEERREYKLQDIFDVTSRAYQITELIGLIKERYGVREYRGITWKTKLELASKLGKGSASYIMEYIDRNSLDKEDGFRKYIDNVLKDSTYEEYVADGYIGYYKGKGRKFTCLKDLAKQVGIHTCRLEKYIRVNNITNSEEIVEAAESFIYRGIDKSRYMIEISELKGIDKARVVKYKANGKTVKETIDYFLDNEIDKEEYRGINKDTYLRGLSEITKIPRWAISNYRQVNKLSIEETIDYFLDNKEFNPIKEYRGIKLCKFAVELSKMTGVSKNTILSYKYRNKLTEEQTIDYYLDTERTYRGIRIDKYANQLCKVTGLDRSTIGDYRKKNNLTIEQTIAYYLDKYGIQEK